MALRFKKTPIRSVLMSTSTLRDKVKDGLGAVETTHRGYLDKKICTDFADSLALDEALKEGEHSQANRWDYLLGHTPSAKIIGLEPHSAKTDQVSTVEEPHYWS